MKVNIDPKENRSEHLKTYVEPSLVDAIREFQWDSGAGSLSIAVRELLIIGLGMASGDKLEPTR